MKFIHVRNKIYALCNKTYAGMRQKLYKYAVKIAHVCSKNLLRYATNFSHVCGKNRTRAQQRDKQQWKIIYTFTTKKRNLQSLAATWSNNNEYNKLLFVFKFLTAK